MFKRLILVLLLLPAFVFAQSSGKIAGVVTDKSTGEPLPGVNVILEGTTMGASTDIDGYYVILNVPVGVYNLRANYIGYKDVLMENVRVSASITTEANFSLEPTTLELEQAIVVTAQRPLVEKNVTSSVSLVTSTDIQAVPVRGLNNLLALQASVVVQNNEIHIRGSRSDEVGYFLDGASVTNPANNTQSLHVIQEAIEEFSVYAGGYTAEFGGANGGIIRSELKTGGAKYNASVDMQTDQFVTQGQKYLGTYSYGYHDAVATLSGPLLSNKIRFFVAGENIYQGDRQRRFSNGFEFNNLVDVNPNNPNVTDGNPDSVKVLKYPDGYTPNNQDNLTSINGTLLFDFSPIKVRVGAAYDHEKRYLDDTPMLNILNTRNQYQTYDNLLLTGRITHILNPKTYYDLNLNYYYRNDERGDDWFGTDWRKWSDSTAVSNYSKSKYGVDDIVTYQSRWRPEYNYILNGFTFSRFGYPYGFSTYYTHENQNYIGGSLDFTSQATRNHELKAGVSARYYTMRFFAIQPDVMATLDGIPDSRASSLAGKEALVDDATWQNAGTVSNYGYDLHGNELNSGFDGAKNPMFMAVYLQDKIEFNDLIINAGLRYDYFDTDDRQLIDPANPGLDPQTGLILPSAWKKVNPFQQLSPRLGFSFPVSERTVFYMQYGKFIQMSELNNIYFGQAQYTRQLNPKFFYINPVGFGLEPVRTTSYEIGFRQQLSSYAAFDITGFYKNIKGQIQTGRQRAAADALISTYERFQNGDFATTKGLEFRFTLRRVNRLQTQINYTLTNAEGTASTETSFHGAVYNNTEKPTVISPLDYAPTHTGSIIADYRFAKNDGGPILERLGLNAIFTFSSGHPYTYVYAPPGGQVDAYNVGVDYMLDTRSRQALEPLGSSTTPWNFDVDLRLDKTFTLLKGLNATAYMRVTNLFNTKNVLNVYQRTGNAYDDGVLTDPAYSGQFIDKYGEGYAPMYEAINLGNGQAYWDEVGDQLLSHPRQLIFGLQLIY